MTARGLTRRELQVVRFIARGFTNPEIADALGLSPWTVKRHVSRILEKLDLVSRVDIAVWYLRRTRRG